MTRPTPETTRCARLDALSGVSLHPDVGKMLVAEIDALVRERDEARTACVAMREALTDICDGVGCVSEYGGCDQACRDIARRALAQDYTQARG